MVVNAAGGAEAVAESAGALAARAGLAGGAEANGETGAAGRLVKHLSGGAEAEAFTSSTVLEMYVNISNPPQSGGIVNIGDNTVCKLTVGGAVVDLAADCVNLLSILSSYDGKTLEFQQLSLISSPAYANEDTATLDIDFGDGLERVFTGRVRNVEFFGANNNESLVYQAFGNLQLADDHTLLNTNGRPEVVFTVGTTVLTVVNSSTEIRTFFSKTIRSAIEDLFTISAAALNTLGIPATIGNPGLEQFDDTELPETVQLSNVGFAQAVRTLAEYKPGVKVLWDDFTSKWVFPNMLTAPTVVVDVSSSNLNELPFSKSTDNRFTAVRLVSDTEDFLDDVIQSKVNSLDGGFIQRAELELSPKWVTSLEPTWTLQKALNPALYVGTDPTIFGLEGEFYWVYKRWSLPNSFIPPIPGTPQHVYKLINFGGEQRWVRMNGKVNFSRREFVAAFHHVWPGANPHVQEQNAEPLSVKLGYYPLQFTFTKQTSVTSDGVKVYTNSLVDLINYPSEIRYPASGYSGTAFTDHGVQRELVRLVDRTRVTTENAIALHNIHKDVIISGSLPFDGDPIRQFVGLDRRVVVRHPQRVTNIESKGALITDWRYTFGKRGVNNISLSTDVAGLIRAVT